MSDAVELISETPRLHLRRLRPTDAADLAAMMADPEQMRFYTQPMAGAEVDDWVAWNLGLYERFGFGTWYVGSVTDGTFLGYCGLRPLRLDGRDEVELAWHIRKSHWSQGLATEAALTVINLGFDRFDLPRLVAIIHPENHPSRRVADKLGMVQGGRHVQDGEPVIEYAVERD